MKKQVVAAVVFAFAATASFAGPGKHHARTPYNAADAEQMDFGIAGDPKKVNKTIKLALTDQMRFVPDHIEVDQGDTVKFIITNKGKMMHEMVLGTTNGLMEHAEMMKKFPGMEHDEPHNAHVDSGKSQQIVWNFNKPGEFDYACLLPGHYEAGMKGKIVVNAK